MESGVGVNTTYLQKKSKSLLVTLTVGGMNPASCTIERSICNVFSPPFLEKQSAKKCVRQDLFRSVRAKKTDNTCTMKEKIDKSRLAALPLYSFTRK